MFLILPQLFLSILTARLQNVKNIRLACQALAEWLILKGNEPDGAESQHMKRSFLLKKTLPLLISFGVAMAAMVTVSPAQRVFADSGLCFDKLIGQTYSCINPPGYPIDGKSGQSFQSGKCYVFADPDKGWETDQCTKDEYQKTSISQDNRITDQADKATNNKNCPVSGASSSGCDIIATYANPIINFLSVMVGIVIVISIVIGGIQYASSRDNPQAVGAAKRRITNAILALLAFAFLYTFLEWVVPGGFLNS